LFRNTLVFLAVDQARLQDLDEAVRRYLAWESIVAETETLNLDPHQEKQAEAQKASAEGVVKARLPEGYQWLLVPVQDNPQAPIQWPAFRLAGQDALAVRATKKLRNDELLITALAGTRLRMALDRIPLWRNDDVSIKQLVEDFARYIYLPRLAGPSVLIEAVRNGLGLLTWSQDSFAYADSLDETAGRYRGLRCGEVVAVSREGPTGLLVRPERALKQYEAEAAANRAGGTGALAGAGRTSTVEGVAPGPAAKGATSAATPRPKRFHGSVNLDPARVGRDAGRIADEVVAHLAGLVGSTVRVTLEIDAEIPAGVPESVVRTVTENGRTLKFTSQGFEVN
jgi:hypothetical protein